MTRERTPRWQAVVKTDAQGDQEWTRENWGNWAKGNREYQFYCPCIEPTWYHEYIFPVALQSYVWMEYANLVKMNNKGDFIWNRDLSFVPAFVQQTQDGGFIVSGRSGNEIHLMKTG